MHPEITCPVCGRVGSITASYQQLPTGHIVSRMDGLDPVNCVGCQKALREHGFTVAAFGPGPTITPVDLPEP